MTCDSAQVFIEAYVDRELDARDSLNVAEHLRTCESCSRLRVRLDALRSVIADRGTRYRAPDELRRRIQSDLRGSAPRGVAPPTALRKKRVFDWKWAAVAAAVLVSTFALWQMQLHQAPGQESLIAREIVASHVRSLMANHLVDAPSSDQHAVKPWFAGKLDFSPTVTNLDAQGFMLAGGRLDYIDNRPVAAVVYRRRQHVINLFVWPSALAAAEPRRFVTVNGFNMVNWVSGGMRYSAISDLNQQELEEFARLSVHH